MSIERIYNCITFECDHCGDTLDTNEDEFGPALTRMKNEGWSSLKEDGEWAHYCDHKDCSAAARALRQQHPPRRRSSDVDEMS